ncbi:hypothetical protein [Arenimonas sp.]|uniref:hypothetical protein n=1 Tax=Arenimonas sp. TaxID=1872635 RepID=UPI0035B33811
MKLAPRASALLVLCLAAGAASAQVSLTGPAYTQDFDTLANSGTANAALPAGWLINETGGGSRDNELYAGDTGGSNSGDTYSYGASGSAERALGGLLSGSLNPTFGACFTNNTGSALEALDIAYTGEQWRSGTAGRADTINFQYSLDATDVAGGTWTDVDALDFSTPNTVGTGAKNGNDAANRTAIAGQIGGLAIANGSGFCIRWTDFNASGADDGLAVDDFSLTPVLSASGPDLMIEMSADPAETIPGGLVLIRTRFTNIGTATITNTLYTRSVPGTLTPAGPAGFEDIVGEIGTEVSGSCSTSGGAGGDSTCSLMLAPGAAATFYYGYTVGAGVSGPVVISGVANNAGDPDTGNNSDQVEITVYDTYSDVAVTLADNADPVVTGGSVAYTATVANNGPQAVTGLALSLPIPAGTTYVGHTVAPGVFDGCAVVAAVLECTGAGPVASGASSNVVLDLQVSGAFAGTLSTTATVSSALFDPQPANNQATETTEVEAPLLGIHDVQGAGALSPMDGGLVAVEGIVTALRFNNAFFVQSASGEEDGNPATSEGLLVYTGSAPTVAVGDRVRVTGTVEEYRPSSNPHQDFITELTGPSVSVISSGNALPAPVEITAAMTDPNGPVDQLEPLEGMRVSVARLVATAPTEGSIDENDALAFPNGNFWGVVDGIARPFREPGIGTLDQTPPPPANTPIFDTNPERLRIQSRGQVGASPLVVDTGAVVSGLVGVLDYGVGAYIVMPDPTAAITVEGGAMPGAVPDPAAGEFTIASANMLRFYDEVNDVGGDVQLTALAFEKRLAKASLAICDFMKAPDILGVVEVENLRTLQLLADRINATCARGPQYQAYLEEGNDGSKINVGFLVNTAEVRASVPRVQVESVVQYGKDARITNPNASTSVMNDRPPLVLRAVLNNPVGTGTPVTVIANHLLSLIDINSTDPGSNGYATTGDRRRIKRAEQAVFLAGLVEQFQQANPQERIVLLGDFNAFEFNDGYVDVMGIVTGQEAANDAVYQYADSPLTTPLSNLTTLQPATGRYSFSFEGNAQTLDHIVVNQALLADFPGLRTAHARVNADFAVDNFADESMAVRFSDHDPVVLYLSKSNTRRADLMFDIDAVNKSYRVGVRNVLLVTVANLGPDLALSPTVTVLVQAAPAEIDMAPPANWTCSKDGTALATLITCQVTGGILAGNEDVLELGVTTGKPPRNSRFDVLGWVQSRSADPNTSNNLEALRMPLAR